MHHAACLILASILFSAVGCATPGGETPSQKRAYIKDMEQQALAKLEAQKPGMKERVAQAPGYGAFSNISTKIFFVGSGNGYGIVTDNSTGKQTYMKMAELGVGVGMGIKEFSAVFVFNDSASMHRFVEEGWELGGDADAAAKASEGEGGAASVGASVNPIDVYQFTDRGLMLNAMINGTKYWKDKELN